MVMDFFSIGVQAFVFVLLLSFVLLLFMRLFLMLRFLRFVLVGCWQRWRNDGYACRGDSTIAAIRELLRTDLRMGGSSTARMGEEGVRQRRRMTDAFVAISHEFVEIR